MQHHIIAKINKHLKRAVSRSVTAVIFKLLHRNNQTDPDFSVHAVDVSEKQREREAVLFISSTGSMSHTLTFLLSFTQSNRFIKMNLVGSTSWTIQYRQPGLFILFSEKKRSESDFHVMVYNS